MTPFAFHVEIYSPRWGHDDRYEFIFDEDTMKISSGKQASCKWSEDKEPVWDGYNADSGNPFVNILENDSIYPPTILISALEHLWSAWRDGTLKNEEVEAEMNLLIEWVNTGSMNKPKTDFWQGIF